MNRCHGSYHLPTLQCIVEISIYQFIWQKNWQSNGIAEQLKNAIFNNIIKLLNLYLCHLLYEFVIIPDVTCVYFSTNSEEKQSRTGNWVWLPRVGVTVLLRYSESWTLADSLPFGRASKMVRKVMIFSFNPHQSFVICWSIFVLAGAGALYCI